MKGTTCGLQSLKYYYLFTEKNLPTPAIKADGWSKTGEALFRKAVKDTDSFSHAVLPSLTQDVVFICTVKVGSSSPLPHPSQWKGEGQTEGQPL